MAVKDIKLFENFPPISTEAWEAKINADLKGKDYERALVWRTNEGFNVRPYYRQENMEAISHANTLPGEFPFVRGNKTNNNNWFIRQDIKVTDLAEANKKALDVLCKGVDSLGFIFNSCEELSKDDFAVLLKDICLDAIEVNFESCCKNIEIAKTFVEYVKEKGTDLAAIKASVNLDPIGDFALKGKFCCNEADAFKATANLVKETAEVKDLKAVAVNGRSFTNAGSSIVQELAFSLAIGADYLDKLTEQGLDAAEVSTKLKFNLGVSGNYFMEMAKLRAGRMLWAKIVKAFGVENDTACQMHVHSETSKWNKTVYDPAVNMLRTQTEAMSAVLGGTDSLTVLPYDAMLTEGNETTERFARNQQSLLKEESYFDKIVDPGAGSYYIETLTQSIAEQAWALFLEVQEKGGFVAAFREGFVQAQVKEMSAKRDKNVATRRENILGVNQFPNFTEEMEVVLDPATLAANNCTVEGAEVETLKTYRGAQAFEALRYQTDLYAKDNKRPLAFMVNIGNLTFRKARGQFACNFFAVAGYDVKDNNGFATIEEGVNAAKEAGAEIVVICSSDDEYAEFVPAAKELLNDDAILVVAGNPACKGDLEAKDVKNFIHVKTNLLEALCDYQKKLGIA